MTTDRFQKLVFAPSSTSEQRARATVQVGPTSSEYAGAVTVVDQHGRYVFANRPAAALVGRTPEQLLRSFAYEVDARFANAAEWDTYFAWVRQQQDRHFVAWEGHGRNTQAPLEATASFLNSGPGYVLTVARRRRAPGENSGASGAYDRLPDIRVSVQRNSDGRVASGLHLATLGLAQQGKPESGAWTPFRQMPAFQDLMREALEGSPQYREVRVEGRLYQVTAGATPDRSGVWCVALPSPEDDHSKAAPVMPKRFKQTQLLYSKKPT